jgi:hypothetical protein
LIWNHPIGLEVWIGSAETARVSDAVAVVVVRNSIGDNQASHRYRLPVPGAHALIR